MKIDLTRCSPVLICFGLMTAPSSAHASDPSGLVVVLVGALAVVFAVVFSITWMLTSLLSRRWLAWSIRGGVVLLFWMPVPVDGSIYWWPIPFALLQKILAGA